MEDLNVNVDEILGQVDKIGEYVAEKLQVPVEMAYEILMKQVWFEFSIHLFYMLIGLGLVITAIIVFKRFNHQKLSSLRQDEYLPEFIKVFSVVIFTVIGLTQIFSNIKTVLQIAINPEWYMIQMILEKVQ